MSIKVLFCITISYFLMIQFNMIDSLSNIPKMNDDLLASADQSVSKSNLRGRRLFDIDFGSKDSSAAVSYWLPRYGESIESFDPEIVGSLIDQQVERNAMSNEEADAIKEEFLDESSLSADDADTLRAALQRRPQPTITPAPTPTSSSGNLAPTTPTQNSTPSTPTQNTTPSTPS